MVAIHMNTWWRCHVQARQERIERERELARRHSSGVASAVVGMGGRGLNKAKNIGGKTLGTVTDKTGQALGQVWRMGGWGVTGICCSSMKTTCM